MRQALGRLGMTMAVIILFGSACAPALADDAFGVARISLIRGSVTMQRGDSGDAVAAAVNAPVTVGDYLSATGGSRAEVQIDNANFVRVGSDTQLRFTRLDPTDHELQLAAGTIELRLLHSTDARLHVDTPSITVRPNDAGSYRISVTGDGNTVLTVRSGSADIVAPQGTQTIKAGVSVLIKGSSSKPQIQSIATVAYDEFDAWNQQRDDYAQRAQSNQYANSNIVGLDDMDSYGRWVDTSDYGQAWVPYNVGSSWAPYRDGRWVWEPGCGWTWVGYEPWGWAPYHYGRWFYASRYGWAWYPGPMDIFPVWQPAFVAFFGFGSGLNLSLAFGDDVGWIPLAPFEPFHPWHNATNITNIINITNITNITNVYKNANRPGGIGLVTARDFKNGLVYRYLPVTRANLHNVALATGALPIVPTKQNLSFNGQAPSPVALSGQFNAFRAPKLPPSFELQRTALQTAILRSSPANKIPSKISTAAAGDKMHAGAANPTVPRSAWDRFAAARGSSVTPQPGRRAQSVSSAATLPTSVWSRFPSIASKGQPQNEMRARGSTTGPVRYRSRGQIGLPSGVAPTNRGWERFSPDLGHRLGGAESASFPLSQRARNSVHPVLERSYPVLQRGYYGPGAPRSAMGNGSVGINSLTTRELSIGRLPQAPQQLQSHRKGEHRH